MKLITLAISLILTAATCLAQNADITISVTSSQNVQINLNPDGVLDAIPAYSISGAGSMQVINSRAYIFVTNGTGQSVITFTGVSQGNSITNRVVVNVVAPPPPATTLAPSANAVSK